MNERVWTMKCYRIRKKRVLWNNHDIEWMKKRNEPDHFASPLYDTLKGAKSALNNRNAYLYDRKNEYEIVEYILTETQVF